MTACIEFTGRRNRDGYGRLGRSALAHRVAWIEAHGEPPAGMVVRHRCDNPPCVNVEHLQLGSQADNLRDMAERGRYVSGQAAKTTCPRGHPYSPDNTYTDPRGWRQCRACRRGPAHPNQEAPPP